MTKTAEWICTECGVTNRKLVTDDVSETVDKCVTCRAKHHIAEQERPVRWSSAAAT